MQVIEAIREIDTLKPNMYPSEEKARWLLRLEQRIYREIISTHSDKWMKFPDDMTSETELLAPVPYDEMYIHFLGAQIDLHNMEYEGFNAENAIFETLFSSYRNFYNRSHMPYGSSKNYF